MSSSFKGNFKGSHDENNIVCTLCGEHPDDQDEIKKCKVMNRNVDDLLKLDEVYSNEVTEHSAKVVDDILSLKSPEM